MEDIYKLRASKRLNKPIDEVTWEDRADQKDLDFIYSYGGCSNNTWRSREVTNFFEQANNINFKELEEKIVAEYVKNGWILKAAYDDCYILER